MSTSDWQSSKSLAESNAYMLDNRLLCDVVFDVGSGENKTEIQAHKYMLVSRSCVFDAMLNGMLAEKGKVMIPDIEPEIFMKMLRYIYTEHVDIQPESVSELHYVAKKYCLTNLVDECTRYLVANMKSDNACGILEQAHKFDEPALFEEALTMITDEGDTALQSSYFSDLCVDCVKKVIGTDDLIVTNEEVVVEAMKNWAIKRKFGLEQLGDTLEQLKIVREALGELLYLIRFPLTSATYFKDNVLNTGLLNSDEEKEVFEQYLFPRNEKFSFVNRCRKVKRPATEVWRLPQPISREGFGGFQQTSNMQFGSSHPFQTGQKGKPLSKNYGYGKLDAIGFSTSNNTLLHGFRIWGRNDCIYKYKVSFSLKCVIDNQYHLLSQGTRDVETNREDCTYIVEFSSVVRLHGWMKYVLEVNIEEGVSFYSNHNATRLTCFECKVNGTSIIFTSTDRDTNGTTPATGQIPCLLCSFP